MDNNMTTETLAIAVWANISEDLSDQAAALAIHRGELTFDGVVDAQNDIDAQDYYVLTDEEADKRCAEYIKETLWAFNPSFLAGETGISTEVFTRLAEGCESSNEAIESIIKSTCGVDSFVEEAIGIDGRGHFLNGYDGTEKQVAYNGTTYYIYRLN